MKFTLVVPTIGRVEDLRKLFVTLTEQTFQDFEVVVVDQSGQEGIAGVVREFVERFPIHHERMSVRGASRARNRGLDFAKGEIVTFPDDDCTLPKGHLESVAQFFDSHPEVDAITFRIEKMARNDTQGGRVTRQNIFGRCTEASLTIRRQKLGELRFDEEIGVGAGTPWGADEGPDLMLSMMERGAHLEYVPELFVWHPDPAQEFNAALYRRTWLYSGGRGYLYRKHRFPLAAVLQSLFRSLGGSLLMFMTFRWRRAYYYWLSFLGKLRGYLSCPSATIRR